MFNRPQVRKILAEKYRTPKAYEAEISNWIRSSKENDLIWRHKITEFKYKVKERYSEICKPNYKEVWDLLEDCLR